MNSVRAGGVCAVLIIAFGAGSLKLIEEHQNSTSSKRNGIASANTKTGFQTESIQAILQLKNDLKGGMTRKEKLLRAYDGAVKTHEIGFPTTEPSKRPRW